VNEIVRVVCQGKKWAYREMFERCRQIVMVMNLEDEEWEEVVRAEKEDGGGGAGGIAEKLTIEERERARAMVKDD
jgi:conserved oligomeric Golgi complex subunit 4